MTFALMVTTGPILRCFAPAVVIAPDPVARKRYRARKNSNQRDLEHRRSDGRHVFKVEVRADWAEAYVRRQGFPIGRDPPLDEVAAAIVTLIETQGS